MTIIFRLMMLIAKTSERASDTLEIVTHHNMPYTRLKGLKEMNFGVFEGKDECLNPPFPYLDYFKTYGGESQDEVQKKSCKDNYRNHGKYKKVIMSLLYLMEPLVPTLLKTLKNIM